MNILLPAPMLSRKIVKEIIIEAKKKNESILEFTAEPMIGPYLTIELKDYNEDGEEGEIGIKDFPIEDSEIVSLKNVLKVIDSKLQNRGKLLGLVSKTSLSSN